MRSSSVLILVCIVGTVVMMTLTLPTVYLAATSASRRARSAVADACAAELAPLAGNPVARDRRARELEARYGLRSLRVISPSLSLAGPKDVVERRRLGADKLELVFAPDEVATARQPLRLGAFIGLVGTLAGVALLALTVVRPAKADTMPGNTSRFFDTFDASMRSMKVRESELKRLRDQEKERADELAAITGTLVRSLTSGFLSIDERGLLVDMNDQARELLRVPDRPTTGRSIMDVVGSTPFSRTVQDAVEKRLSLQRQEVGSQSGDTLIGLTTVPLRDAGGRYFGMLALFTDLLPVQKLEQRLRDMQSLADLGEMSAGIAHEFRNSLSTVLGYLSLARKTTIPPEVEERIGRAQEEAKQLNAAVESLLAFARPMPLAVQPVDLGSLMEEVVEQMRPLAPEVAFDLDAKPAQILGDPLLLKRAAENVIRNAVESIREKGNAGRVAVVVAAVPGPTVVVSDDGVGVDPARAATLLLPFQSTKRGGFGLGLALTRKIVLLHGGTITLTGQPGVGATVEISFGLRVPGAGLG